MTESRHMTLERQMVETFLSDYEGYKEDFVKTKDAVAHSKAIYKGQPVPYLHIPKLYGSDDAKTFEYALHGIHNICKKTIDLYLAHEGIRKLFDFDARLDALGLHVFPIEHHDVGFGMVHPDDGVEGGHSGVLL